MEDDRPAASAVGAGQSRTLTVNSWKSQVCQLSADTQKVLPKSMRGQTPAG